MRLRPTIRDLFRLAVVLALAAEWYWDHSRLSDQGEQPNATARLGEALEK